VAQRLVPFLGYEDAAGAIEWLERAFGFREERDARYEVGGTITHAELSLEGATIYVSTPEGYASPRTLRAESEAARRAYDNPWVIDGLFVEVDDVDAHHERALGAGATILRAPEEPGIGMRIYTAEDPEGHRWMFGQQLSG
jgi:uncharacterized glyoxalase superfamily protein PhnB